MVVKLSEQEVTAMLEVDKSYGQFLNVENGRRNMFLKLNKALYGTLKAAIIWYNTFTEVLKGIGFKINRYDPCVANVFIGDSQATIVWHVDDCKVSHRDPDTVSWILDQIKDSFEEISITRGRFHTYIGMDLEYVGDDSVKISAEEYTRESIRDFGEDVSNSAITPAENNLFDIKDDGNLLTVEKGEVFHSIVGKTATYHEKIPS